jgi:hypothetical protein
MIILDAHRLKFLLNGRAVSLNVDRAYRVGRDYALGTRRGRPLIRVAVLACRESANSSYEIKIARISGEEVRLLARNSARGYVSASLEAAAFDPKSALRGALAREPEAIDAQTLERYAKQASERDDELRRQKLAQAPSQNPRRRRYAVASSLPVKRVGPGTLGLTRP